MSILGKRETAQIETKKVYDGIEVQAMKRATRHRVTILWTQRWGDGSHLPIIMRMLSWNCQGLGTSWIVRSLHKIMKDQAPTICFLMKTRLNKDGFKKHCRNLPFPNQFIVKKPDSSGGLALLWKDEVVLDVINFTTNHILAKVIEEDGFIWYLIGFYGWSETNQKSKSWALLTHQLSFVDGPWMCIGNFNTILHSSQKLSRRPPPYNQMEEFRDALKCCQLSDWGSTGILTRGTIKDRVLPIQGNSLIMPQPRRV